MWIIENLVLVKNFDVALEVDFPLGDQASVNLNNQAAQKTLKMDS